MIHESLAIIIGMFGAASGLIVYTIELLRNIERRISKVEATVYYINHKVTEMSEKVERLENALGVRRNGKI
jgi:hypothetical protein